VVTVAPARPRTLIGQIGALRVPRPGKRATTLAAVIGKAARDHLTTFAAFAALDLGCFEAWRPAGWMGVCVSLIVLDWKVRG
jgi:hypothetical protein